MRIKVLITGSDGFIGKNLQVRLGELEGYETITFNRNHSLSDLEFFISQCDVVVHLAGVNRPIDIKEFERGNIELTSLICRLITAENRNIPLIISSSIQAVLNNPYGESKRMAEEACKELSLKSDNSVSIFRLPGVFGKWSRPDYNSVVSTFCYNIANDLEIQVIDPATMMRLVYIDDVVSAFIETLSNMRPGVSFGEVRPTYEITLGDLAAQIKSFKNCRSSLVAEPVGTGLIRALYATYVSYLPPSKFSYSLPKYGDERGIFVEVMKTKESGQFSFFTAHPGVTRGGHYHHSKTEKFLVIKGNALFGFRNIMTGEKCELFASGDKPRVVETIPGWAHDVTNIGKEEMVVMLWANEIFDHQKPDTIAYKV